MAAMKPIVEQMMEAIKKPRRLVAQADGMGRVEGEVVES
jgi:hypothetical protein